MTKSDTTPRRRWLLLPIAVLLVVRIHYHSSSNCHYCCSAFRQPTTTISPHAHYYDAWHNKSKTKYSRVVLFMGGNQNDENNKTTNNNNNPLSSFWTTSRRKETKTETIATLEQKQEQLAILETKRVNRVREDALPYLFLLSLQTVLPLVGTEKWINTLYFLGTAITTVYLGSRQLTTYKPETFTKSSAARAPIGASLAIGFLYALLKVGIDPTTVYSFLVTIYGVLGIYDVSVPILRAFVFPENENSEIVLPPILGNAISSENDENAPVTVSTEQLVALGLGIVACAIYWSPMIPIENKFLLSNLIAWSIGMASLGVISLGSFQTGVILLAGLFFYDIFFVFGTDVMMTVALKIEAPVKFLYPAPPSDVPREYPFSVLGLGDIVVPGFFVRFMTKVDENLGGKVSYATATTIAYGLGLAVCFVVNEVTKSGQPALLYLNPACIGAALACGAANGQLTEVWNFEDPDAPKISSP